MKVSIAMATYNGEAYLQEQLDSFTKQTRLPDEVVVSDDHSGDRTIEILRAFEQHAPFQVKLTVNDENAGYKRNFGKVLSQASGDLIFMSDQDDVWFAGKIEKVAAYAESFPGKQVFINDTEITDSRLKSGGRTKMDQIRSMDPGMKTMIMGTCTAIRRPFLNVCLPIPEQFTGHDDWLHQVAKFCNTRVVINEPLQYYRIHGANTSDNIANTTKKVNVLDQFFKNVSNRENSISKLEKRLMYIKTFTEWLKTKDPGILQNFMPDGSYGEKLKCVERETEAIQNRLALYQVKKTRRIPEGIHMLGNGDYAFFNGWKSLIKDFFV